MIEFILLVMVLTLGKMALLIYKESKSIRTIIQNVFEEDICLK